MLPYVVIVVSVDYPFGEEGKKYHYQNAQISDFMKIEGVVTAMISEYPFNSLVWKVCADHGSNILK